MVSFGCLAIKPSCVTAAIRITSTINYSSVPAEIVKRFFERQNIEASWTAIKATPTEKLVTSLAMSCPFGATERQALIETPNFTDRAQMLLTLLEMALLAPSDLSDKSH